MEITIEMKPLLKHVNVGTKKAHVDNVVKFIATCIM
jgi:hypothetical protein